MTNKELKSLLDEKVLEYNNTNFIPDDPVSIPHLFTKKQDIEIAGLIAAVFAWGQRKTIINKSRDFLERMDNDPHSFVCNHSENDLKSFLDFKHRTFNAEDALYFIHFFNWYYQNHESLETSFIANANEGEPIEFGLEAFHNLFISLPSFPSRTKNTHPNTS